MQSTLATILIIDDDRELADTTCHYFQREGYDSSTACSKNELMAFVSQSDAKIDVILLGLLMPDITGEEALTYLRNQPRTKSTPIIIFSAITDVTKRIELIHKGADDYIVKPAIAEDLLARVAIQVKLNQLRDEKKAAELYSQRQAQYLQTITQVSLRATQYLNIEQLAKNRTKLVSKAFTESQQCCLYIVSSNDKQLELIGVYPRVSTAAWVLPDRVQQIQESHENVVSETGTAVAICQNDKFLGVLDVQTHSIQVAQEIAPALTTLAIQLATIITNIRLFNNTQKLLTREQTQRKQVENLYYMAQIISSSLEEDEVVTAIIDTIRALFSVETAGIRLIGRKTQHFTFSSSLQDADIVEQVNQPKELGIIDYVVNTKKPITINHVPSHPRFKHIVDAPSTLSPRTILCTPLIARNIVIGAIQLINKEQGMFDRSDLDLLNMIASTIAVAIDNAQLYQQQVQLAEKLKQSQSELIQSEKMSATGRLAASLAHEINNPLQAIDSCLQLTIEFDLTKPEQMHYLGMAREEVERLSSLIRRILDFAHPATNEKQLVNVNTLVEQVLNLTQKHIAHHKWDIQTQLAKDLPPILVIPDQISQVFLSIILNAFDAIAETGSIRIVTKHEDNWVKTIISDNGCGMSAEVLNHIFEPFYTTKPPKLSGLGLTISYQIIEQHGGNIEIESREQVGSVFCICLPVTEDKV